MLSFVAQNFSNSQHLNIKSRKNILLSKVHMSSYSWFYLKLSSKLATPFFYRGGFNSYQFDYNLILNSIGNIIKLALKRDYSFYNNVIYSSKKLLLNNILNTNLKSKLPNVVKLQLNKQILKLPTHAKTYNSLVLMSFDMILLNSTVYQNLFRNNMVHFWINNTYNINPTLNSYYLKVYNI